jgi:hypothetical protein
VKKALRNFRYGLLEETPEDQFMRFWLSLEILAVNHPKDEPRPATRCRHCAENAVRAHCGKPPPTMPSSKDAIIVLTKRIVGAQAESVYRKLFDVRNGLAHGKNLETVLAKSEVSWPQLLFVLARLVSDAILLAASVASVPSAVQAYAGIFAKANLVGRGNGTLVSNFSSIHHRTNDLKAARLLSVVHHISSAPGLGDINLYLFCRF